jgi:hypothetical protein
LVKKLYQKQCHIYEVDERYDNQNAYDFSDEKAIEIWDKRERIKQCLKETIVKDIKSIKKKKFLNLFKMDDL